jgi:hypothetical protein
VDGECKFPMTNTPQLTRNPAEFESTALRVIAYRVESSAVRWGN